MSTWAYILIGVVLAVAGLAAWRWWRKRPLRDAAPPGRSPDECEAERKKINEAAKNEQEKIKDKYKGERDRWLSRFGG